MSARQPHALDLNLHPKQWVAFLSLASEILYGGAVGGGKSFLMRAAAIVWCASIPNVLVYLFRRISDDLIKNHMEGRSGFRAMLAPWVAHGWCKIIEDKITFWNGSKIFLCHCKDETSIYKYQGSEMDVLMIDELTHFTDAMYRFLRGRLRQTGLTIPASARPFPIPESIVNPFPRILCGSNPGNIGHLWVKQTFISDCEPLKVRLMDKSEGGMIRQFIPATLNDNLTLKRDDPDYDRRVAGMGSENLVKAMLYGDWDVVDGAFFDCWRNDRHVIPPFSIPRDWLRFRSGDWGGASPSSFGWWAVVQDDYDIAAKGYANGRGYSKGEGVAESGDGAPRSPIEGARILKRGALIRYREDYVASGPNKGLKLTAEQLADRIIEREKADPKLAYAKLDPTVFKSESGPSIAERINGKLIKAGLCAFSPADNTRVSKVVGHGSGPMSGWDVMRQRMIGTGTATEPEPMIFWFSTCLDSIRTIPVLQHDIHQPEDIDKNAEDHVADEVRYACLSRPYTKTILKPAAPKDGYRLSSEAIPDSNFKTM